MVKEPDSQPRVHCNGGGKSADAGIRVENLRTPVYGSCDAAAERRKVCSPRFQPRVRMPAAKESPGRGGTCFLILDRSKTEGIAPAGATDGNYAF